MADESSEKLSYARIAERAYFLYLERGCPQGCDLELWLCAEGELRAQGDQADAGAAAAPPHAAKPARRGKA